MTDNLTGRAEKWLRRHHDESRAFGGDYKLVFELAAALKAAQAENEQLRLGDG